MIERYDPQAELVTEVEQGAVDASARATTEEEDDSRTEGRTAKRVARGVSLVVVGAVLGLVIVGIMKFVNDPAQANTQSLSKAQASVAPTPYKPPVNQLGGLNVSFSYPGEFDQMSPLKNSPRALEQYMLGSKGNYRHSIAVEVNPLDAAGLSEDANYRVRMMHPADYSESREQIRGEIVVFMTKSDKSEQTMFWAHDAKVLMVAITTTDPHDDLAAFMAVIKSSVRWR